MSKVYVFLAEGFEEVEALTPVDLLRRAGIDTQTVSIGNSLTVTGRSDITVKADLLFEEADPDSADMLVLPGGMPGTRYLMAHKGLENALKKAAASGRYTAAICAAPSVLAAHGILNGKKATSYPGFEGKLAEGGASPTDAEEVVTDGTVITSRGAGTAIPFALKLIEVLKGKECAAEIGNSIIFGK